MQNCEIWFDGGAGPTNPGWGYGSYEVRIVHGDRCEFSRGHKIQFRRKMTNNEAEYWSLLLALDALSTMNDSIKGNLKVSIWTDSMLVCQQVLNQWKCKKPHLKEYRDLVQARLKGFCRWSIKWHRRNNNMARFGH